MQEYDENSQEALDEAVEQEVEKAPKPVLVEEHAIENAATIKRGKGRPDKRGRYRLNVTRDTRVPVGGYRDILTLENTDPDFHYYWEIDTSETGPNIHKRLRAGYDFVRDDEGVIVGQASVFKTESVGSILRVPNGDGRYLYLMKIPMEWFLEDMERNNQVVDETEDALRSPSFDGSYKSGISIGRDR